MATSPAQFVAVEDGEHGLRREEIIGHGEHAPHEQVVVHDPEDIPRGVAIEAIVEHDVGGPILPSDALQTSIPEERA